MSEGGVHMLNSLFKDFTNIIVFDVETTGTDSRKDEIIEIAMLRVVNEQGAPVIADEYDVFIKLSPGKKLPAIITEITGITGQQLHDEGLPKGEVCEKIVEMLSCQNLLLAAYNAQFDLSFLFHFLNSFDKAGVLNNAKVLDALTIYRDRRPYPHKLSDAANMYSLTSDGAHRAYADTIVTFDLLCEMGKESDDLFRYVNLFGYNPKYGVSGSKISSVRYLPQGYGRVKKLYEEGLS